MIRARRSTVALLSACAVLLSLPAAVDARVVVQTRARVQPRAPVRPTTPDAAEGPAQQGPAQQAPAPPLGPPAHFKAVGLTGLADQLTCLGISHRDPNFVMVGTSHGRIHRTTDGGASWQEVVVTPNRTLFFGRERSPDPRLEYALGLPGKSPHLQSWLRQKGLHTSGINLQQLLVQKGDKTTSINWIEVDWHDENRVFVATTDGLYRSTDKGRTFLRIWQGRAGMQERVINTVVTDPAKRNRLMVGTARGLFTSDDAGAMFKLEMDFYVRDSYIRAMFFDEQQAGLVHMAMGGAAMASPDGGEHWITTYWDLWGPRSDVQWISLGPNNVRLIGTRDGVYASFQGGEMGTWSRRGVRFIGHWVGKVVATHTPNDWYAGSEIAIWRTTDAGNNWKKVFQLGGSEQLVWLQAFRGDPQKMWLLTNRQVYRSGPVEALQPPEQPRRRPALADIPDLHTFWKYVMKKKKAYYQDVFDYKARAPWAALLPFVVAGMYWGPSRDLMYMQAFPYKHMPWVYNNRSTSVETGFEVFAFWELDRLIFDRRELPQFGRVERNVNYVRMDLTERVMRLYREYKRLARQLAFNPPAQLLAREFMRIRLQEIGAFFDAVSGGYWSAHIGGKP